MASINFMWLNNDCVDQKTIIYKPINVTSWIYKQRNVKIGIQVKLKTNVVLIGWLTRSARISPLKNWTAPGDFLSVLVKLYSLKK